MARLCMWPRDGPDVDRGFIQIFIPEGCRNHPGPNGIDRRLEPRAARARSPTLIVTKEELWPIALLPTFSRQLCSSLNRRIPVWPIPLQGNIRVSDD